ncbi:MAG TPA: ABC transporter substrate-binding protein [Salinivirgaceae bacterium]|nr:ABC transporter substrate-binding protein [Salinivirgaceae bacterium]
MKNRLNSTVILLIALILTSCNNNQPKSNSQQSNDNKYAQGFEIITETNGYTIKLLSPWMDNFSTTYTYKLTTKDTANYSNTIENQIIPIPLKRVAIMSTTHLAMITALEETHTVVGISESRYVYDSLFWKIYEQNNISDIGYENSVDVEKILELNPDAIFVYGLSQGISQTFHRIVKMGVPVVFVSEFNETTPLAKLEWLRFMGCFYNKLNIADSIINHKIDIYNRYKDIANQSKTKPTVLAGLPWKDMWNISGGNTVTATFISDAGGDYLYSHLNQKVNYQLGIEDVFLHAGDADFWINSGIANSLSDISMTDKRFVEFKAFANKKVFNNNKRQNSVGGNDYLESGIINPEIILKDLISILHPELISEHELHYYKQLE